MEDLIPILIGVIWMVVSAVRNNRKQKEDANPSAPKSDVPEWYRSLTEAMGQPTPEAPKPQPVVVSTSGRPAKKREPFLAVDSRPGPENLEGYRMSESEGGQRASRPATRQVVQLEVEEVGTVANMTDWREAFVHSIMLERPYR